MGLENAIYILHMYIIICNIGFRSQFPYTASENQYYKNYKVTHGQFYFSMTWPCQYQVLSNIISSIKWKP